MSQLRYVLGLLIILGLVSGSAIVTGAGMHIGWSLLAMAPRTMALLMRRCSTWQAKHLASLIWQVKHLAEDTPLRRLPGAKSVPTMAGMCTGWAMGGEQCRSEPTMAGMCTGWAMGGEQCRSEPSMAGMCTGWAMGGEQCRSEQCQGEQCHAEQCHREQCHSI